VFELSPPWGLKLQYAAGSVSGCGRPETDFQFWQTAYAKWKIELCSFFVLRTGRKNRSEMEGKNMSDLSNTQFFQVEPGPQISARDILEIVFKALKEKGYNPVNQIVGYVMSGDPTYITSYNGARSLVMKVERDELVEELLKAYIEHNSWA